MKRISRTKKRRKADVVMTSLFAICFLVVFFALISVVAAGAVRQPAGLADTLPGCDPEVAGDVLNSTPLSRTHAVSLDFDFGFYVEGCTSTISGTIFYDINGDGEYSSHEPVAAGVAVVLYRSGEVIWATESDESGRYYFTGLSDGDYTIGLDRYVISGKDDA